MEKRRQRKAAERDRQRNDILDVALDTFAARGYQGTSMNEVAEEAGYSVGHIYNVIGNKEALFEAVMVREGTQLVDRVERIARKRKEQTAAACIDELVDAILEFFDSHRAFFEIYLNEAGGMRANVERRFSKSLIDLKKRADNHVRRLFSTGRTEGLTTDVAPSDMTVAFGELINGFITTWATGGYRGRISRKARVIKHLLWKGIQG
jgi:AcrR family transcriptional regulator